MGYIALTTPSTTQEAVTLSAVTVGTVYVQAGDLLGVTARRGRSPVPYENVTCPEGEVYVMEDPPVDMRLYKTYGARGWTGEASLRCRTYSVQAEVTQCEYKHKWSNILD